ncbi:MAG: DNA primase [Clostridia bacterium]
MAYYLETLIEEVVTQNDIVELISEYVSLKKGGRNFMGLCPFHREKSPSFCVSSEKQIYKCFGCSEGGNIITFVMKLENLDFWDSVEFLAQRAHLDLSKYEVKGSYSKKDEVTHELKNKLFELNKDVAIYYHNNLIELLNEKKNLVKDYIIQRKLDIKTINRFGIGYADGKISLYDYLIQKGYKSDDIFATGIVQKSENGRIYDRFYSRLIFPIFDVRDRVIAFGGRVLDKQMPKYVNSSENQIYTKGKHLYALNFAKREKLDNVIIVEGYMDTIALHKNGYFNTIASLGTALTDNQARLIKKYCDNVIIAYDQDSAGQEATMRGLDILVSKNINVKVLMLDKTDVKDPDEYINKYGYERFRNCINNSISLVEYKIAKLEKTLDINNIDSKINFLTQTACILAQIENNIERELYIDKIAKKYNTGSGPIIQEVEKRLKKIEGNNVYVDMQSLNKKMQLVTNIRKRQEQYIIALLLSRDKTIQSEIIEKISPKDIENEDVAKVYMYILNLTKDYDINKIDILSKIQDEHLIKEITDIMYIDISSVDKNKLLADVLNNKNKEKLYLRRDEIIKRMNLDVSKDEQEVLQLELNQIVMELSKYKK